MKGSGEGRICSWDCPSWCCTEDGPEGRGPEGGGLQKGMEYLGLGQTPSVEGFFFLFLVFQGWAGLNTHELRPGMNGLPKPPHSQLLRQAWKPRGLPLLSCFRVKGAFSGLHTTSHPHRLPGHPPKRWCPSAIPWLQLRGHWPDGRRWQASGHAGTSALSGTGEGAGDCCSIVFSTWKPPGQNG